MNPWDGALRTHAPDDDSWTVGAMDVLAPGIGEIVGGK
jgi:aspartyl/asparaginyl-tRNA synthetase